MKGAALGFGLLALGLAWAFRKELRCLWIGRHETVRYPLGGCRCSRCGKAFADWDAAHAVGEK